MEADGVSDYLNFGIPAEIQDLSGFLSCAFPPAQLHVEAFLDGAHCSNISTASKVPVFLPIPEERTSFPCGACSLPACQGKNVGDFCGIINGTVVHCVWSSFCGSGPGTGRAG